MTWRWPFGNSYRRQLDLVLAVAKDLERASLPEIFGQTAVRIRAYYQASYACVHPSQDAHVIQAADLGAALPLCPCAHSPGDKLGLLPGLEADFYGHACKTNQPTALTDYLQTGQPELAEFMGQMGIREAHAIPLAYQGEDFAAVLVYFDRRQRLAKLDTEFLAALGNLVGAALQRELKRLAQDEYEDVIQALSQVIEAKDGYTSQHVARVTDFSVRLARAAGLDRSRVRQLRKAAALHDIGKVGVPDAVLGKDGPLDDAEWQTMRRHPVTGDEIVRTLNAPDTDQVAQVVRHHHERLDGKGYPDGLAGDAIPLPARIVAICDSFDAMTSDRPYRKGIPLPEAIELLRSGAGTQWDAELVEIFVTKVIPGLQESRAD